MALCTDSDLFKAILRRHLAAQEAEIKRMLGCWVSELEPVIAYNSAGELLGLTIASPVGTKMPIAVEAFPKTVKSGRFFDLLNESRKL